MDPYRESAAPASKVRRYVPSGAGGLVTLIDVLGLATLAGVAAGAVEGFVDEWFSLLVFFPMLIGLAAGGAAAWMVARKRLRAPMRAAAAAFLGAALGYTAMHVVDYQRFRSRVVADVAADPAAGGAPDDATLDDALVAQTGHGGFLGYLQLAAGQGIAITSVGHSSGNDMTFSGKAAWGLWLAELLLAAGVAGVLAYKRAGHPFCEPCDAWFTDAGSNLVATQPGPGKKRPAEIVAALDAAALDAVGQAFAVPATSSSAIVLVVRACTSCKDQMAATLRSVWHDGRKAKSRDHATWVMARSEAQAIGDAVVVARADQPR